MAKAESSTNASHAMKNFFSAIQGKFDAKYHGRYLGNIIEQIAAMRRDVVYPLIKVAPLEHGRWPLSSVQNVDAESLYLSEDHRINDRRADLLITLESNVRTARILIEIKMHDQFLKGQLEDYVQWVRGRDADAADDRAVVVLTAFPLSEVENAYLRANRAFIKHMYLSEFMEALIPREAGSELISLFADYLREEGYAMYQLLNAKEDMADLNALRSFFVLNFLPHQSGHSRVASSQKVARGPIVFSNLIQNWQLVSDRLASLNLKLGRRPTVRYFPQQAQREGGQPKIIEGDGLFAIRRQVRLSKEWGRYWLTADCICRGEESAESIRIEWGQIIEIHHGDSRKSDEPLIDCAIYAMVRKGAKQLGGSIRSIEKGIENPLLYSVEPFMKALMEQIHKATAEASANDPAAASCFPWRS